jgi:hypothetical protein
MGRSTAAATVSVRQQQHQNDEGRAIAHNNNSSNSAGYGTLDSIPQPSSPISHHQTSDSVGEATTTPHHHHSWHIYPKLIFFFGFLAGCAGYPWIGLLYRSTLKLSQDQVSHRNL